MTQAQLERSVAARTGESPRTIHRLGFGLQPTHRPTDSPRIFASSSTARSAAGPSPIPVLGHGTPALAECPEPRCDVYFDFAISDVYVVRS